MKMWVCIGIIGIAMVIFIYEMPKMMNTRRMQDMKVFLAVLFIATTLSILHAVNVQLINPLEGIISVYKPLGKAVISVLQP